ncbi:MAG: hypothetical protein AAGC84_07980 [Pseudomonas sp.]
MLRYRTLLVALLGLFLAGCVGYDYDDNYDRGYGRGYGNVYSAPVYSSGYSVQRYPVYSAPRYYSAPPVYRAPAPRYYVPAPAPRYYGTPHRAPVYQGWNQPPRGYYQQGPGRGPDRHHSRGRDDHRRDDHRGHDDRRQRNR